MGKKDRAGSGKVHELGFEPGTAKDYCVLT